MPAYLVARVVVHDQEQYNKYALLTPDIVAEYGGKFLIRAGAMETVEGEEETNRIVVVEFPDREKARGFYYSDAYQEAMELRKDAADGQLIIIDGFDG